jgi:hypothetical protein
MAGDQIEQDADTFFVGLREKPEEVLVGSIAGCGLFIVPHIVARILKGRIKTGVDPQGVTAETMDIIQFLNNPLNVAYPVAIGVVERLGIDFVKYCIL